jgi:hypothetical protein
LFVSNSVRLRFSNSVRDDERREIVGVLSKGLPESSTILPEQSRVKSFYKLDTSFRPLFAKVRTFPSWSRRLGRAFRKTKEEREFENYLILWEKGILCPQPVAAARLYRNCLIYGSILLTEYLSDVLPLRVLLTEKADFDDILDDLLDFLVLLRERGVIHEDLQWDNVLVRPGPSANKLFLVDALHVRFHPQPNQDAFEATMVWFLRFLVAGGVPHGTLEGLLARFRRLGLDRPGDRARLLEQAQRPVSRR